MAWEVLRDVASVGWREWKSQRVSGGGGDGVQGGGSVEQEIAATGAGMDG